MFFFEPFLKLTAKAPFYMDGWNTTYFVSGRVFVEQEPRAGIPLPGAGGFRAGSHSDSKGWLVTLGWDNGGTVPAWQAENTMRSRWFKVSAHPQTLEVTFFLSLDFGSRFHSPSQKKVTNWITRWWVNNMSHHVPCAPSWVRFIWDPKTLGGACGKKKPWKNHPVGVFRPLRFVQKTRSCRAVTEKAMPFPKVEKLGHLKHGLFFCFFWGPRPNTLKKFTKSSVNYTHLFHHHPPLFFQANRMEGIGILRVTWLSWKIYFFFTPKTWFYLCIPKKNLSLFQRFLVQKSGPKKVTRCTNKWTPNKIHTNPPLHRFVSRSPVSSWVQVIRCFPKYRRDWEGTFDGEKQNVWRLPFWRRWISGEFEGGTLYLVIQAVTFLGWWVHVTLSRGCWWPLTGGSKGHIESPGSGCICGFSVTLRV